MRTCPSCGFGNVETAARCQLCGRGFGESEQPAAPSVAPPPSAGPAASVSPAPPPQVPPQAASGPPPGFPPSGMAPSGGYPPPGFTPPGTPYSMVAPVPPRPPVTGQHHSRQFLIGMGLGAIPLIVALVGVYMVQFVGGSNSGVGLIAGGALYLVAVIAMIVCLSIARVRFVGYGLLAAVAASPIIFGIGCVVILTRPR